MAWLLYKKPGVGRRLKWIPIDEAQDGLADDSLIKRWYWYEQNITQPANTVAPTITGNPWVGSVLTANEGTWTGGSLTYTYQWKADGVDVAGATGKTRTLQAAQAGKAMTVVVTATNLVGNASQQSAATAAVIAAPTNTAVPTISGTAQVGQTLTAANGTWTGSPAFTRQWKANGTNISGATATTYIPVVGDVGKTITVTVTGTNAAGNASATSAATAAVIAA
jgi:hypothetical protein